MAVEQKDRTPIIPENGLDVKQIHANIMKRIEQGNRDGISREQAIHQAILDLLTEGNGRKWTL